MELYSQMSFLIEHLFWLRFCGLGNAAQMVEHLPNKPEVLGLIPSTVCRDKCLYFHHLEGGGKAFVQGSPWLYNKFRAILDYTRPCLKNK